MTDIETRSFRVPFELRTDGENQTIVGYASTFDQPYPVDMVTEIIDRSAFTRTLSEKPDVYALIGHDPSRILGRTKNGTLSLSIDERGLKCVITPVMTRDAEDTLKLIASGCIDAMSFGFKVVKQAFGYADGKTTRRITDLELHEVSCVAFPANENATLSLRAKQMARECRSSQGNDHWQGNYGNGIEIPPEAWQEMSGSGQKDSAVSRWVNSSKIVWSMDDEAIAKELKEHGAWSKKELSNAKENKKRILWIASNDISEKEGRSSSTKLETREAFNPINYEYGVFQVKKQSENQTDENGEPLEIGWYFSFRKGRTKDSDNNISEVFGSKSEATNALNKEIEVERNKWEATEGRSAGAVKTRADNSDVIGKLPQSIIHIKNEDGNIFAKNIQTNDVIAVMTDDYDDEEEFYESQDIKDIKDVQGFADYLLGLGLVEKGDVVMSAGKKYVVRSTPATKLETQLLELRNRIASPIDRK